MAQLSALNFAITGNLSTIVKQQQSANRITGTCDVSEASAVEVLCPADPAKMTKDERAEFIALCSIINQLAERANALTAAADAR